MKYHLEEKHLNYVDPACLVPYANNPRTHSKRQIRQIARSIEEFGFTNPILVGDNNEVLAGHGRLEAAKLLGMETVPTIRLAEMSDARKRAYILADNKIAENAGWDESLLAIEFQYLVEFQDEFEITITGFETPEIDLVIGSSDTDNSDPEDEVPEIDDTAPTITEPGDLWLLGNHRLLCADATRKSSFGQLMDGERAQMVFTDPPYNVPINGNVCGLGSVRHDEFAMASGEMSSQEFTAFLTTTLTHAADASCDGSIHYVCMDWRHMAELLEAGGNIYSGLKNLCVWAKTNGGMGSLYRSQHELVFVFKKGTAQHVNNVELGRFGRNRTNLWTYPGVNSLKQERMEELAMHPTVKPVAMVEDAILDCSDRNGIVLDPFCGSGTTIIAAERAGRIACGMELDPRYVDVAIRRWQAMTGKEAIHERSGLAFDFVS